MNSIDNFKVGATILGGELPIWTSTCRIARYRAWDFGRNSKMPEGLLILARSYDGSKLQLPKWWSDSSRAPEQ
jgi:hypothetical protein